MERMMWKRYAVLVGMVAVLAMPAWADRAGSFTGACWVDEFDTGTLNNRWQWVRESAGMWELDPTGGGCLRITTESGGLLTEADDAGNLLLTDVRAPGFDLIVEQRFRPTENFQFAGAVAYVDDANFVAFGRAFCGLPDLCVGEGLYVDCEDRGVSGDNFAARVGTDDRDFLRLIRVGRYFLAYRSPDRADWQLIGAHEVSWRGSVRAGLGAWGGTSPMPTTARFESVSLNPDTAPTLGFVGNWESDAARYRIAVSEGQLMMTKENDGQIFTIAYTGMLQLVWKTPAGTPTHFEADVEFDPTTGSPSAIRFGNGYVIRRI